ncbi:MAG: 3-deoxy-8-phosphooctulonate synthase [Deltaproteobacteria bacterium]|nr:3-deoxy-8-phosphooctulonate synthase [Deltaproteobacteria bacterium]
MKKREIRIKNIPLGGNNPLVLIAGPCVIEGLDVTLHVAGALKEIASSLSIPYIFKTSYDKANRSSLDSYRGPGFKKGLEILQEVKEKLNIPVLSDVHRFEEIESAATVLDVIQIPALLSRQTDLIIKVAETGRAVNIKKGQFMSPHEVKNIIDKVTSTGNHQVLVTERGFSFGYNNLVADMRSLVILHTFGYPVVFDATHSVQLPGGLGSASGGQREFATYLSRAATAVGIDALFVEVHPQPDSALCDGPNMLELNDLPSLLKQIQSIDHVVKGGTFQ